MKCDRVLHGLTSTIFSITSISKYVHPNELLFARDSVRRDVEAIGAPSDQFLNFRFWKLLKCDGVLLGLASTYFSISSLSTYVPQNTFYPRGTVFGEILKRFEHHQTIFYIFDFGHLVKFDGVLLGLASNNFVILFYIGVGSSK